MRALTIRRLPSHFEIRRWRALLMMLALHGGLMSFYFILLTPFVFAFDEMFSSLGAELPSLTQQIMYSYHMPLPYKVLAVVSVTCIDALIFIILRYNKFLTACWSVGFTMCIVLMIALIPLSLFLPLFCLPSLIPSS